MITLIRMKYKEWKLKLALYTVLEAVAAEQKDIAALLSRLYAALKDVPLDELRGEFLGKLAVHSFPTRRSSDRKSVV